MQHVEFVTSVADIDGLASRQPEAPSACALGTEPTMFHTTRPSGRAVMRI